VIGNAWKYKRRATQSLRVREKDRSGSKVPPSKRKAKRRAQRKATEK
jgi:hypothetical protein